jgi:hypothetical protein
MGHNYFIKAKISLKARHTTARKPLFPNTGSPQWMYHGLEID